MKKLPLILILLCAVLSFAQNVTVNPNLYTPQQLVEDVLIDASGCVGNVTVTNAVSGNFSDNMLSYGYFQNNGGSFPFSSGIVMSTGRLNNVEGPNTSLSDDNANNWGGDADLNSVLGINNTVNATVLEFDFTPYNNNIQFNYIFASEEYQEGNGNTCIYSDVFAFLIKPIGGNYTNIAVVPGTNTPVQVTTVHPEIPGSCPAENETYFGSWNNSNAPINFNGQTTTLTAQTTVTPNQTYHIKLVIADEQNYRYDSAVFLEAASFNTQIDLGEDQSFQNNNPLCPNETYTLDATTTGATSYNWYRNGTLIPTATNAQYTVTQAGTYTVEVDLGTGCTATDDVLIQYSSFSLDDETIIQCDSDGDQFALFNLYSAALEITNGNNNLQIQGFFESQADAENVSNPIDTPYNYTNTVPNQTVYALVQNQSGCTTIVDVTLSTMYSLINPVTLEICDTNNDGYASFILSNANAELTQSFTQNVTVSYFSTEQNALLSQNSINSNNPYQNTTAYNQTLYAKISNSEGCIGITQVYLVVHDTPDNLPTETIYYCLNTYPQTITLATGLSNETYNFSWSTGATTPTIEVNEAGTYTVSYAPDSGCGGSQTFEVLPSSIAEVDYTLTGTIGNMNLEINATGNGVYEYALDDTSMYQENPQFYNLSAGEHTFYVQDVYGCSVVAIDFLVIDFPLYFTPNNDGINDTWNVLGLDRSNPQIQTIYIFDRYGKLLREINPLGEGWDGTYNNNEMPSSDYWYRAVSNTYQVYNGHFTLKR